MLLKNARIINPENNFDEISDLRITDNKISKISKNLSPVDNETVINLTGKIIAPGLVDIHCHLREPGFEEKETIETGIKSAINGGYTAICPMANTNPIVDNIETLKYVQEKAKNIGFYPICAITKDLKGETIVDFETLKSNGAIAFSDDGKPVENLKLLKEVLLTAKANDYKIILHSEDSSLAHNNDIKATKSLKNLSGLAETVAIARELEIVRETGTNVHFAHVSTKRSIELIRQAKNDGLQVTCETAPHYFSLTENDIKEPIGVYKVNPPLRTQEDLKAVIEGLKDGTIDAIATDHAPHTKLEKLQNIDVVPMGIAGFETALGVSITYLVEKSHLSMLELIGKLSTNPAKIFKLENQGNIKIGEIANLTIIDPHLEWIVKGEDFKSKCKLTPFKGKTLKGKAIGVIIEGKYNENKQNQP